MAEDNLDGLLLLLVALAEEGRDVLVLPRSQLGTRDLTDVDYVVVEDATFEAWRETNFKTLL